MSYDGAGFFTSNEVGLNSCVGVDLDSSFDGLSLDSYDAAGSLMLKNEAGIESESGAGFES